MSALLGPDLIPTDTPLERLSLDDRMIRQKSGFQGYDCTKYHEEPMAKGETWGIDSL